MIEITQISLSKEPAAVLREYSRIPSTFRYSSLLEVIAEDRGVGGLVLKERAVAEREKDYDEIEPPMGWADTWDLSNWVVFYALVDGEPVGGCIVAHDTEGVDMLDGRLDVSALWDIRVSPRSRKRGIGSGLFSRARKCRTMRIETQNNNLPACRFYARNGCELESIRRFHYRDLPEETQLI